MCTGPWYRVPTKERPLFIHGMHAGAQARPHDLNCRRASVHQYIYLCVYIYIDIDSDMQVTRARGHALFPFPLPSMVPSLMVMMVVRLIAIKVQNVRHRPTTTVCGVFQGTTIDLHG